MIKNKQSIISIWGLIFFVAASYFWGVLSFQHYLPSSNDFLPNAYAFLIVVIGLTFYYLLNTVNKISTSTILWFMMMVLIAIQPLFNEIIYADNLIFPIGSMLMCALLAWAVAQMDEKAKQKITHFMSWVILLVGCLTILTQVAQLHWIVDLIGVLVFMPTDRLTGNVAQVNQAAFVISLAMASLVYLMFYYLNLFETNAVTIKKKQVAVWAVASILMIFLGVGIGFCASRGGLLLAAAVVISAGLLYKLPIKTRLLMVMLLASYVIAGYFLGTGWMNYVIQSDLSAVDRMVNENSLNLRVHLLQQGWLAFMSSPITGIGWDNMIPFVQSHSEQLVWFTAANHVHNIVAQIAGEFGLFGIIIFCLFIYILLKNFSFKLPAYKAYAYAILMLVGMYSLSEYPLWFVRFLIITAFFVAVVDSKPYSLQLNFRVLNTVFAAILCTVSTYYLYQYYIYKDTAYIIQNSSMDNQDTRLSAYNNLPNVFGFSDYKELVLFNIKPITFDHLEEQIKLGNQVLSKYTSQFLLTKQGTLYMVANEADKADQMFHKACIFNFAEECQIVIDRLDSIQKDNSDYAPYYQRFETWYEGYFSKAMPEPTVKE